MSEIILKDPDYNESQEPGDELIKESTVIKALTLQYIDAARRSRSALIVLLLVGLVLSIAAFNYRSSWLQTHKFRDHDVKRNMDLKDPINPNEYPNYQYALIDALNRNSENEKPEYHRHLYHDIFDGVFKTVDVPAIGLEFYIEDLPLIGSFGLSIALLWFYFVRRRERGIIKIIRRKVEYFSSLKRDANAIEYLYHNVSFNQVFNVVHDIDDNGQEPDLSGAHKYLRRYLDVVIYLPLFVLLMVFSYDTVETYFWPSPNLVANECKLHNLSDFDRKSYESNPKIYVERIVQPLLDSLENIFVTKLSEIHNNTGIPHDFEKRKKLKAINLAYQSELEQVRNQYYRKGTLMEYIRFNKNEYDQMNTHFIRLIPNIETEIIVLRTIVPIAFILWCIYLARVIWKLGKKKDLHYLAIEKCYLRMLKID